MKLLRVMSRENARKYTYTNPDGVQDFVIVSINSTDSKLNMFCRNPHMKAVHFAVFDDVEGNKAGCMSREDAEEIIQFVNQFITQVDEIIVHCDAGISRSAGVCAGLMRIINNDDSLIFENKMYCPNMHCYRMILDAYFGGYNCPAVSDEKKNHIDAWRIANGYERV